MWGWLTGGSAKKSQRVVEAEACFTKDELRQLQQAFNAALQAQGEDTATLQQMARNVRCGPGFRTSCRVPPHALRRAAACAAGRAQGARVPGGAVWPPCRSTAA